MWMSNSIFWVLLVVSPARSTVNVHYKVCKFYYSRANIVEEVTVKRRILCAMFCGKQETCRAVTIYALPSSEYRCVFHDGFYNMDCDSFVLLDNEDVRMYIKNDGLTSSKKISGCYNGGTFTGSCVCRLGYRGPECERFYYDCKEAKDSGLVNAGLKPMIIQPEGSTEPFEITCNFMYGLTLLLSRRTTVPSATFARPMHGYMYGFGVSENVWAGLERVHALVNQPGAAFKLQMYCQTSSNAFSVFYPNFVVDGAEGNYSFSSGSALTNPGEEDSDGLGGGTGPHPFCSFDQPCAGRPTPGEGGWWFTPSNSEYASTRSSSNPRWKYVGSDVECIYLSMQLERTL